jgi:ABC-type multidrug transport system ATPase subunit
MRPAGGTAVVGGFGLPRRMAAVRRISAPAHMAGVTDLEPALTVGEHLRERVLLQRRFGDAPRSLFRPRDERRRIARERTARALEAAGLDPAALPKGTRTTVRDLERLEVLRLSVALALIGRPRLLAVDDVGLKLSDEDRDRAWALLADLAAAGTTVVAAGDGALSRTASVVRLANDGHHDPDSGTESDTESDDRSPEKGSAHAPDATRRA